MQPGLNNRNHHLKHKSTGTERDILNGVNKFVAIIKTVILCAIACWDWIEIDNSATLASAWECYS